MSMFGDVNKVTLMGNVTNDPDLRFTPSGSAVLNFSVATNRSYKKGEEWVDEVTYHNLVVWRSAEPLAQRIRKGTRVYVEGRIQTRSWENAEGQKQYKTEVVADDVNLVARYEGGKSNDLPEPTPRSNDIQPSANVSQPAPAKKADENTIDPDDLPF